MAGGLIEREIAERRLLAYGAIRLDRDNAAQVA